MNYAAVWAIKLHNIFSKGYRPITGSTLGVFYGGHTTQSLLIIIKVYLLKRYRLATFFKEFFTEAPNMFMAIERKDLTPRLLIREDI